jgi:hypothetical protein
VPLCVSSSTLCSICSSIWSRRLAGKVKVTEPVLPSWYGVSSRSSTVVENWGERGWALLVLGFMKHWMLLPAKGNSPARSVDWQHQKGNPRTADQGVRAHLEGHLHYTYEWRVGAHSLCLTASRRPHMFGGGGEPATRSYALLLFRVNQSPARLGC